MSDKGDIMLMMQVNFKKIVSKHYQQLYSSLIENLGEMEKFLIER